MGDFLCAVPVIVAELNSGTEVTVLLYPQVLELVELLDLGHNRKNLRLVLLPIRGARQTWRQFLREMSRLSPNVIWISPHSPATVASWKIPLILWVLKKLYWPKAKYAGADSEPLSWLFDVRVPVNRHLPYEVREWVGYRAVANISPRSPAPTISFRQSITDSRSLSHKYDIVIHPGAGTTNRRWPVRYYAELLSYISPEYRIALVGLPQDVEAVRAQLPADREIQLLSGSLEEAIISIARSRVALTMDSGSMHFAKVLGVPTVALFGPSDPENVIPPRGNVAPIYKKEWSCQPCRSPRCRQRAVFCMGSIEPKMVANELARALRSSSDREL